MRLLLRISHGLMAGLFIFAAALQYNDLDLVRWVAIYLAAATVCIFGAADRPKPQLAAGVALIAVLWSLVYFAHGAWRIPLPALFSQWEMKDQSIVAGRELNGLLIIFVWMAIAWATGRTRVAVRASN
jgi:transmembrane protein TMEM220